MDGHGNALFLFVRKGNILAKQFHNLAYHSSCNPKLYPHGFTRKHIEVLFHVLRQIQALSFRALQGFKGFSRLIQNAQLPDMVKAVIGNVYERIIIADQIIFPLFCYHLVRAYNI